MIKGILDDLSKERTHTIDRISSDALDALHQIAEQELVLEFGSKSFAILSYGLC